MVCYIRKYVIILGDIPVDVPPTENIGGCVPGIPGGVDACAYVGSCCNLGLYQTETGIETRIIAQEKSVKDDDLPWAAARRMALCRASLYHTEMIAHHKHTRC